MAEDGNQNGYENESDWPVQQCERPQSHGPQAYGRNWHHQWHNLGGEGLPDLEQLR